MRFLILALLLTLPLSGHAEEKSVKAKTKKAAAAIEAQKDEATEAAAPKDPNAPFALTVKGLLEGNMIAEKNAYCIGAGKDGGHGPNVSPALSWTKGPKGTKSYALIVVDPDVPTDFTNAGKQDVEIPIGQLRQPFYHWALANISGSSTGLKEGADGKGMAKKAPGKTAIGVRGINDYTKFLSDNPKTKGIYAGYDGPCPPWNDARVHRYIFTLYALDVPSLKLANDFTGRDLVKAMQGHVLAKADVTAHYTLNPRLKKSDAE